MTGTRLYGSAFLLIFGLVAIVFSNTLGNPYHFDSVYRIQTNPHIEQIEPVSRFFLDRFTNSSAAHIAEYRPMMTLSNALDVQIARSLGVDRLTIFHAGNLLIHATSAFVLFLLLLRLVSRFVPPGPLRRLDGSSAYLCLVAALIFAVHPVSGSTVNYLAARDLLLMVLFLLSAFGVYVYMRTSRETFAGWLLSLLLLCLALLSKQGAIVGFGLVFLFEWLLLGQSLKNPGIWWRTALFALPTVAYLMLHMFWVNQWQPGQSVPLRTVTGSSFPLTMMKAHLWYYGINYAWPFEMRVIANIGEARSLLNPAVWTGGMFILATLFIALKLRRNQPLASFAILSYWALMALTSSVFTFRFPVTDYRQYAASAFAALLLAFLLFMPRRRAVTAVLATLVICYFSLASFSLNQNWQSAEKLWGQSVRYGAMALGHVNYALSVSQSNPGLAAEHYRKALELEPGHGYAVVNLSNLYLQLGEEDRAIELLRAELEGRPDWAAGIYWHARVLESMGEYTAAQSEYLRALELEPASPEFRYRAGRILLQNNDAKAAITHLEPLTGAHGTYLAAAYWLGFAHMRLEQWEAASRMYQRHLVHQPGDTNARFNLAIALLQQGRCDLAITELQQVLQKEPDNEIARRSMQSCKKMIQGEQP